MCGAWPMKRIPRLTPPPAPGLLSVSLHAARLRATLRRLACRPELDGHRAREDPTACAEGEASSDEEPVGGCGMAGRPPRRVPPRRQRPLGSLCWGSAGLASPLAVGPPRPGCRSRCTAWRDGWLKHVSGVVAGGSAPGRRGGRFHPCGPAWPWPPRPPLVCLRLAGDPDVAPETARPDRFSLGSDAGAATLTNHCSVESSCTRWAQRAACSVSASIAPCAIQVA